jgi:hypothetical protein
VDSIATTGGTPLMIASLPNATQVLAVDPPYIEAVGLNGTPTGACPVSVNESLLGKHDLGQGNFTPTQFLVAPDSANAFVITTTNVIIYNVASGSARAVSLANSATPTRAVVTSDGKTLYVGGSDSNLHVIDVASATETGQASLSFVPDLLAIRY